VVDARRQGKWMHYRVVEPHDPRAAQVLRNIHDWIACDQAMQKDRGRLVQICCAKVPLRLKAAPKPAGITA